MLRSLFPAQQHSFHMVLAIREQKTASQEQANVECSTLVPTSFPHHFSPISSPAPNAYHRSRISKADTSASNASVVGDVVDAGSPLVLLAHRVQTDEVLLCMARNLKVDRQTA